MEKAISLGKQNWQRYIWLRYLKLSSKDEKIIKFTNYRYEMHLSSLATNFMFCIFQAVETFIARMWLWYGHKTVWIFTLHIQGTITCKEICLLNCTV